MDKLVKIKNKVLGFSLNKSWQYLLYINLVLPGVLLLLGWLLGGTSMGKTLGIIFHNYGLFVSSPIPNFSSFTGILGLALAVWFLVAALRKRDWLDFGISLVIVAANAAFFLLEANYLLLSLLVLQ